MQLDTTKWVSNTGDVLLMGFSNNQLPNTFAVGFQTGVCRFIYTTKTLHLVPGVTWHFIYRHFLHSSASMMSTTVVRCICLSTTYM